MRVNDLVDKERGTGSYENENLFEWNVVARSLASQLGMRMMMSMMMSMMMWIHEVMLVMVMLIQREESRFCFIPKSLAKNSPSSSS